MNAYVALFVGFTFGFVLAQARYTRMLNRSHGREERLNEMLRASHQRNQETRKMLHEARTR